MPILISGSMAFDVLMEFDGHFADHILSDQIDKLNVSFLTPRMRSDFGGCAANVAYAVKQLGGEPIPVASIGQDGGNYLERLRQLGIATEHIAVLPDCYTAQCVIVTDRRQNQFTAFHPGAMAEAHLNAMPLDTGATVAIVSPDGKQAMQEHAQQLHRAGIPFVFDPGQAISQFAGDELHALIDQATWLTLNEYEAFLLCEKTGLERAALASRLRGLIVTLSGRGCEIWTGGETTVVEPFQASEVVDPTGCGDAWRGALMVGLERGWPLTRAARLGNYMGARKIAHRGPQNYHIDPEDVAAF